MHFHARTFGFCPTIRRFMGRGVLRCSVLCMTFMACIMTGACYRETDTEWRRNHTLNSLRLWGEAIGNCLEDDPDEVTRYTKIAEVIAAWRRNGRLEGWTLPKLRNDDWGNELVWVVRHAGDEVVVRVISAGKNGKFEGGNGDDIYVEVRGSHGTKPKIDLHYGAE